MRTHALVTGLAMDHEVTVVAGAASGDLVEATGALAKQGVNLLSAPLQPPRHKLDLKARLRKYVALARGRSSLLPRFFSSSYATVLAAAVSAAPPDVIMLDHVWMADYLPLLPRHPLLFSTQNVESQLLRDGARRLRGFQRSIALREAELIERREAELCAAARLVLAVTHEDKSLLTRCGARAVEVIPNGVALAERPLLPEPPGPPKLFFVGGADYPPNAEAARRLAQHVLPLVRERHPEAQALLVGADPEGRLADLASLPGVRLLGPVPDMRTVLEEAHLLVAPLTTGGGSRLKILEAFASGRAVVTTVAGAAGLPVHNAVELLLAESNEALAAAALRVLADAPLRQRLISAGRCVAEAHDWPDIQRNLRTVIAAAFGRGASGGSCA